MTKEEAIALAESNFWEQMTPREIAMFQLHEPLLCMPFSVFHKSVEESLGRPVFTHEFANSNRLSKELLGQRDAPTLDEIINMIPADKRVIVITK